MDREAESFVKRDVVIKAQRVGAEVRNLELSSSNMSVSPAETANGIERRVAVHVSFIYRCQKTQTWKDGSCESTGECTMREGGVSLYKRKGVWQYGCRQWWHCTFDGNLFTPGCF